jgi:crotonobetainyl-CoA:carnitine CoA-transferase CaiB-like acyl-CoA transferase
LTTLSDIRVIDFGQYVAGPAVAMMFADLGAEVIRVDPPGGTMWKSPAANVLNRGKRRISLDLKAHDDLDIARELILSADVVIENFRPGVMDRLGRRKLTLRIVTRYPRARLLPQEPRLVIPVSQGTAIHQQPGSTDKMRHHPI